MLPAARLKTLPEIKASGIITAPSKGSADVAQPAEQPPCKWQVTGSIPVVGSR
jgi:hypothetical protein